MCEFITWVFVAVAVVENIVILVLLHRNDMLENERQRRELERMVK